MGFFPRPTLQWLFCLQPTWPCYQSLPNPFNGRAGAFPGIEIPIDQGMSLENPVKAFRALSSGLRG